MILKNIKIFSQNICKNNFIINTILEIQCTFDIIFIQELFLSFIYSICCGNCCSNHSLKWHLQYAYFSKAHKRLSNSGDYKRTRQGALIALLLYLYKYNIVRATTICLSHILLLIHHAISICSDVILFNLHHHVCTIYIP